MKTQLLDSERRLLETSLSDFERTFRSKPNDQEKLEYLSAFLKKFVNASPRLRLALSQSLYSKDNAELFHDVAARQKATIRLLFTVASAQAQLAEFDVALELLKKVVSEATALDDRETVAEAENLYADALMRTGKNTEAIKHFEIALSLFRTANVSFGTASVLNNLGILYVNLGEYSQALACYQQASAILESIEEEKQLAPLYNNIGQAYFLMSQFDEALEYYEKSLALCDMATMQRGIAMLYGNIGAVNEKKGNLSEALRYQQKSLQLKEEIEDKVGTAVAHHHIGRIYLDQKNVESAILSFKKSLAIAESIQHDETTAQALIALAQTLTEKNKQKESESPAIEMLFRALELAEKISSRRLQQEAHVALAKQFEHLGEFQKAFHHFKKHHTIKAEIFNEESDKRIKNLQVAFKVEEAKKQAEIERIKNTELAHALAEAERQRGIAEEASRIKSEVLNVVAHDLQTPISSVINFTYLLKQSSTLSEKQLQMLSHIEHVANAVLRQTVNLLNAASEKISDDLRFEKINLSNLLKSVAEQSNALRKNQTIELRVEPSAMVVGDEEKLREVFENLVGNAVKYSPRGTRIEVCCEIVNSNRDVSESGIVRITVKDEGQGLTEGDKEKLFGKFQRLSAKPTAGENSTGLGLYIAKQIVEKHNGKIWAESEGAGKGSTFVIELPTHK
ncbi:MAG: tetratricopeptide repeat-containing sensor histidine kinase [Chloroherpetonaceae bacterium]